MPDSNSSRDAQNRARGSASAAGPLVSIIIPSYNRAQYLAETIDSVLAQDYRDLEIIVIDDGSTDNPDRVLRPYEDRVSVIHQTNLGENATVNRGFALAKGQYVCVVNSDDPLLPHCISRLVHELEATPRALIAYGDWAAIGPNHEFLKHERLRPYTTENMLDTLNFGMGPGMLIRQSAISRFGARLAHYRFAGDMEFCLRLSLYGPFIHVPQILATHRVHADSLSIKSDRAEIGHEFVDAFKSTIANPAFPQNLRGKRYKYLTAIYRVMRDDYATSWWQKSKYWLLANAVWLFAGLRSGIFGSRSRIPAFKITRRLLHAAADMVVPILRFVTRPGRPPIDGKPARFAFCTRFLPPLWSGQAVVISRLLKNVDPASYRVVGHLVASPSSEEGNFIGGLPAKLYELPAVTDLYSARQNQRLLRGLNLSWGIWQRAWHIVRALRHDRPEILIGCTGDQIDPPATWLAAQILRSRFCMYFFDDYGEQWWADPTIRPIIRIIQDYVVPRSHLLIAPNSFMAEKLAAMYGVNCYVVPNPMPNSRLPKMVNAFPAKGNSVRLVFTGAVYHLNYDALRSIVAAISSMTDIDAELHIYTAQSHEQIAAEGISGAKVILHQHVRPDEVVKAQRNADFLLIPFNDDPECAELVRVSATAKLADYLATGRPILAICPPDSFLSMFLRERQCGLTLAHHDPLEIQNTIRTIATHPQLRKNMGIAARKCAKSLFHPDRVQKSFLSIMRIDV